MEQRPLDLKTQEFEGYRGGDKAGGEPGTWG